MEAERVGDEFSWSDPMVYLEGSSELSGQHEHTELVFVKYGGVDTAILERVGKGEVGVGTGEIDILRSLKFRLSGLPPSSSLLSRMEALEDATKAAACIARHREKKYGDEVGKELDSMDALYEYICVGKLIKRYNDIGPAAVAAPEFFEGDQEQLKVAIRQQWKSRYQGARERLGDRVTALKAWEKQARTDGDLIEIERVQREKRRLNGAVLDYVMRDQLDEYTAPLKTEEQAGIDEIECLYRLFGVQLAVLQADDSTTVQLVESVAKQQDRLWLSLDTIMPDVEAQIEVLDHFSQYAVDNARNAVTRMHRLMARDIEDPTERQREMHRRLSHHAAPRQMLKTWDELSEVRENNEGLLVRVDALELQLKAIVGSGLGVVTVLDRAILETLDTAAGGG